jgi:DNA-binding MurR/RpiR family transcriptional regulator
MRNLLTEIEGRMPTFSKGQKLISRYILDHYDKAAYMTASKLGSIVQVSESTVVRFAIEMGYEGYPEFQHALQEMVRTHLTSFQRMEVTNHLIGDGDVLEKVLNTNVDNIRHTLESISRSDFRDAVEAMVNAKNIYIIGVRSSAMLAGFLSYSLQMIFDNVRLIDTTAGSELFQQMMTIGEGDVLVAISFPRYSKRVIKAVEFATRAGADVVALTDSADAPIAHSARQVLIAQSDMASYVDSLVAPLSLLNALIVAVSRARESEVRERLHKLESIWEEYEVYETNQG